MDGWGWLGDGSREKTRELESGPAEDPEEI
jgi:hypothetical protein